MSAAAAQPQGEVPADANESELERTRREGEDVRREKMRSNERTMPHERKNSRPQLPPPEKNKKTGCPGTNAAKAGKASACAGCPNAPVCAAAGAAAGVAGAAGAAAAPAVDPDVAAIAARLSGVRHKVLVLSGKGGVGKSTVAAQLAHALAARGKDVGLLDVDLCGPSAPRMLGASGRDVHGSGSGWSPVAVSERLSVMSIGFLLPGDDDAVIWRGPRKNALIKQFLRDVDWGGGGGSGIISAPSAVSTTATTVEAATQTTAAAPSSVASPPAAAAAAAAAAAPVAASTSGGSPAVDVASNVVPKGTATTSSSSSSKSAVAAAAALKATAAAATATTAAAAAAASKAGSPPVLPDDVVMRTFDSGSVVNASFDDVP